MGTLSVCTYPADLPHNIMIPLLPKTTDGLASGGHRVRQTRTVRVSLAVVDASGSSPAFAAARHREAKSPANGISRSGDAPAGQERTVEILAEWIAPHIPMLSQSK